MDQESPPYTIGSFSNKNAQRSIHYFHPIPRQGPEGLPEGLVVDDAVFPAVVPEAACFREPVAELVPHRRDLPLPLR